MSAVSLLLGILVGIAAAAYARRRLEARMSRRSVLTDQAIREIEERGELSVDDPLDWDEVREEEERFWGEGWDEPEEL
ncbi:MAG TPA: hypothetical protein VFQ38_00120 [Longimicrobiales bacterium]|nr:hypothetical protein [Longimicrobiales bacterium]